MTEAELASTTQLVLIGFFVLGAIFGAIGQKTHFCTMGAIADIVNMGDWNRMRMWWLAIGSAMAGTAVLQFLGIIDVTQALYGGGRVLWVSAALGGLLFGLGMVLASGCGSKTLIRIGAGNLKSLVVFFVLGISAYMTLRGLFGVWRAQVTDPFSWDVGSTQAIPQWLFADRPGLALLLSLVIAAALMIPALRHAEARTRDVWLGGLGSGAVIVGAWWVSGSLGFTEEHPLTLEATYLATQSARMEAFSFVAPFAHGLDLLMFWSDTSRVLTTGVAAVAGVIVGSAIMALATGSFRWEGFSDTEDTANHLVGGLFMGAGGVLAMGCTVGQGLSAISMLAVGSLIAVPAIVVGAVLGLRYQAWRIEKRFG